MGRGGTAAAAYLLPASWGLGSAGSSSSHCRANGDVGSQGRGPQDTPVVTEPIPGALSCRGAGTPGAPAPAAQEQRAATRTPPVLPATSVCSAPPAIAMLKDKEPGSFIVRDSHSFRGAYGLAMKVATPPPSVLQLNRKGRRPGPRRRAPARRARLPCPLAGDSRPVSLSAALRKEAVLVTCKFYFFVALNG